MDILNDTAPTDISDDSFFASHTMIVGVKQLKKALIAGNAVRVFLAEDADPALTRPIESLCRTHHVQYTWVCHMAELGRACKIDVGAAAAAAVK